MQLYTPWGRCLDPDHVLQEYPRSQMRRESYVNLNGFWQYTITPCSSRRIPENWDGTILVPFSPETALSRVQRQLQPDEYLWYRRTLPKLEHDPKPVRNGAADRVLLHFGAVDQICAVYINGQKVTEHTGGYLPFSADITDFLHAAHADHPVQQPDELVVRVQDLSDTSFHARGKQKLKNGGMYYQATSGIWQTVWLETVPAQSIQELVLEPRIDEHAVCIRAVTSGGSPCPLTVEIFPAEIHSADVSVNAGSSANIGSSVNTDTSMKTGNTGSGPLTIFHGVSDTDLQIPLPEVRLWDTEYPWLYSFRILMHEDQVTGYFAMRMISIEKDDSGLPRICLNHQPIFLRGVLDQGYWPESYYTPPSDEAIVFDLTEMKRSGFNMVRKHAKIEPDRWYYHCDRLGLLVWQDIVNGGDVYDDFYVTVQPNLRNWKNTAYKTYDENKTGRKDPAGREIFRQELIDTVHALYNHPSIFSWTLFNEGWGQFETQACTDLLRSLDTTRPIDATSGWFDQHQGDFKSVHNYFFPFRIYPEVSRAFVLSEFGGLPLLLKDHSTCEKLYGYGKKYRDPAALTDAYRRLCGKIEDNIPKGLCATVYTQWTDIEDEVNGVYTWDREVKKIKS